MNETVSLSLEFFYWYSTVVKEIAAGMIAQALISNATPIIIQPVTYGEWVECESADYNYCCSNCGYGYTDNKLSYCYDCGAKMDAEDHED